MKKYTLILGVGLFYAFSTAAQNDIDAMRYSQLTFGGTARFASMAGSMGALGGDISTLSFNPAGIAVFRKTELTITPSIYSQHSSSSYNTSESGDGKLNFNLGNIGLVTSWNTRENNRSGWESFNFGFGYNRTNNFHSRTSVQGSNKTSSLLDTYVANANGHSSDDFDRFSTDLAWQTYLLNPDTSVNLQYNHVIKRYGQLQRKSVESKGSMGETVLSFGGNYKGKVLVGGTVGFVNARYVEESVYEEIDDQDTIQNFKSFTYSQDLNTKGNGVNFKLGFIVKPTDWFRVGAAIHTPTVLGLKDEYSSAMRSDLESVKYDTVSPKGSFDYSVTTPFRVMGSIGFIINKNALLNVDYEHVDYTYAQLYSSPNVFADVNKTIRSKYTSAQNIRVGGEIRFDPLSFRAGYALYGSPFKTGDNKNANRTSYTAGIGFRENNYFIDFAYVFTKYSETSYLYDPTGLDLSSVKNDYRNSSFMLTFGVKF
ncbi:MAG: outer membrane protein transport protein [Bacteroidia bacterium]|nr:outer membrane protein transport protein [Bacteroidia bacterium]